MTSLEERIVNALEREREYMKTKGAESIALTLYQEFDHDAIVIQYTTTPILAQTLRKATTNSPSKTRYFKESRIAIYVRGYRASSVQAWREYFDITGNAS